MVLATSEVFEPPGLRDQAEKYQRDGYAVVRGLLSQAGIRKLLAVYAGQIVPSRQRFFRQSTNAYEVNRLSTHGFVQQSFLDIHDYSNFPQFSRAALDLYCCPALVSGLRAVTGFTAFSLMQSMLFDQNTETPPHQDWYYLDSVPAGNLVAAWIALEDIHEDAGRLFVVPRSHDQDFGAKKQGRTHAQWLQEIKRYTDEHAYQISVPALNAGDVLFWNSRTVHGSLPTRDARRSRKSLTGHYLPLGHRYGNIFAAKENPVFKTYAGMNYYRNQPDYSVWNRVKFGIKTRAYNYPWLRERMRSVRDLLAPPRPRGADDR